MEGCAPKTYTTQYGNYSHNWLEVNKATDPQRCHFDNKTVFFMCKKTSSGEMYIEQNYNCQDTSQTKEMQNLADKKVDN